MPARDRTTLAPAPRIFFDLFLGDVHFARNNSINFGFKNYFKKNHKLPVTDASSLLGSSTQFERPASSSLHQTKVKTSNLSIENPLWGMADYF